MDRIIEVVEMASEHIFTAVGSLSARLEGRRVHLKNFPPMRIGARPFTSGGFLKGPT